MALEFDFATLVNYTSSPAWQQRRDAAEDLGDYGAPEAIPYLARLLRDTVGAVQYAATVALGQIGLGKIGTEAVVPALLGCLDNPHFDAHQVALEALGNLRVKEAVPYLIRYLRHTDPHVRAVASAGLIVTTREAMGFRATAEEARREAAVQKWERWWAENKSTFQPGELPSKRRR